MTNELYNVSVYVAVCCERHEDEHVEVFIDLDQAIEFTWEYMRDRVAYPDMLMEDKEMEDDRTKYYVRYELESDHAYIVEAKINAPS